jgi:dGTPase
LAPPNDKRAGRLLGPLFTAPTRAPFATAPEASRGRFHREEEGASRTCYGRDRDRIVHSAAFRRLKHKTQVFVQHEGDYYRTRLTHSLEVAQIARSIARVLGLDEDLAEALALAHDIGHPPFGHAGEAALDQCMEGFGGFDHNAQALATVTRLERRYAAFDGLNLTWEMLEGLVKHNGPLLGPQRGRATLPEAIAAFDAAWDLELASQPGIEAQVAALSDDIAYVNHDIDDGLRAALFTAEEMREVALAGPIFRALMERYADLDLGRLIGEAVRRLITILIDDVIAETRRRLATAKPTSAADVRAQPAPIIAFSRETAQQLADLKGFLMRRMYRHPRVMGPVEKAQALLSELFGAYAADPVLMPPDWSAVCGEPKTRETARAVCDYIAGMTDRFAVEEHARIFHAEIPLKDQ